MAKVSQEYIDILLKEKVTCTGMYNKIRTRSMGYIMEGYTGSVDLALFVARIDTIREEL
jgi:hypothetical protein